MIDYLISTIFGLALAITSGGILIASHLRTTYRADFLSSLLFFQVFWFTFGFYAIWGQIIIVILLKSLVAAEHLVKITNITIFMAAPFLLFAWLMFLKMAREISGRKTGIPFIALFISLNFLLVPGIGYFLTLFTDLEVIEIVKYGFILLNLVYTIIAAHSLLSIKGEKARLYDKDMKNLSAGLLMIMILENAVLLFYEMDIYITLAFILLFYAYGGLIPVYLRYRTDLSKLLISGETNLSFEHFCEKHEISKREKEVIHEICNGLSNQQIADRLFISLQTVKDHTHRIYGKINCNSRAQLISMVNENN